MSQIVCLGPSIQCMPKTGNLCDFLYFFFKVSYSTLHKTKTKPYITIFPSKPISTTHIQVLNEISAIISEISLLTK